MHHLLCWLVLAIHTLFLWEGIEGGLEIDPPTLLIGADSSSLERQDQSNIAYFTCLQVAPDQPSHRPPQEVVWMKDGQVIKTLGTKKYRHYRRQRKLRINDLNETDTGLYECALSTNSTEKGRAELWIAPRILSAPSPQSLVVGTAGTVECLVTGGVRKVDWWKNMILVASSDPTTGNTDPRYTVSSTGSLIISPLTRSDKGFYRCIVKNKAGQVEQDIRVKVSKRELTTLPPQVVTVPDEGEDTSSSGRSLATESSQDLGDCVKYNDISFQSDLPFVELNSSDASIPQFTATAHECVQTRVGYRIKLACRASGHPTPTVEWTKNGQSIQVSDEGQTGDTYNHYVQLADGSLMITTVQLADDGRYTCTASNSLGSVSTDVQLEVTGEQEQCGVKGRGGDDRRSKRIVQGFAVSGIDEWPWQVLIEYKNDRKFCGGALIRPDWIVTAAHCLFSQGSGRSLKNLIVRMGVHNRTDEEPHQQLLKIQRYIIHPSYTNIGSSFTEHDIALLHLAHPIRPSIHVGTVCLLPQSEEPPVGTLCTVTGWGTLQHGVNEYPELLHRGQVPLVSHTVCSRRKSYGSLIKDNMLCAGWRNGGTDACQNDSGGPLVCEIPESNGRWALYGIVNYGHGCGAPHKYGVYARVKNYLSWIDETLTSS